MDLLGDWKVKSDTHGLACNLGLSEMLGWLDGWGSRCSTKKFLLVVVFVPFELARASEVMMLM